MKPCIIDPEYSDTIGQKTSQKEDIDKLSENSENNNNSGDSGEIEKQEKQREEGYENTDLRQKKQNFELRFKR